MLTPRTQLDMTAVSEASLIKPSGWIARRKAGGGSRLFWSSEEEEPGSRRALENSGEDFVNSRTVLVAVRLKPPK